MRGEPETTSTIDTNVVYLEAVRDYGAVEPRHTKVRFTDLEVLFIEAEHDRGGRGTLRLILHALAELGRAAIVDADGRLERTLAARQVGARLDRLAQVAKHLVKVWAPELHAALERCQSIKLGVGVVDNDVGAANSKQ